MKMNGKKGTWGVALAALMLVACVEQQPVGPQDSPEEVVLLDDWCEGGTCEPAPQEEEETPAPVVDEEPEPEEPVVIIEPTGPTEPETPTEPTPEEPTPEERPDYIDPPTMGEEISLIETHGDYTCAVIDDAVTCWGNNTSGQAQPPAETPAEQIALGFDFACAASRRYGIVCWGDGAWRVSTIVEDHTIFTRHTVSAFDASDRGVLCYNADYGRGGLITCGDDNAQWTVGTHDSFGVSVDHLNSRTSLPIVCHIEEAWNSSYTAHEYSYYCTIEGETWEIPAPNRGAEIEVVPQIKVDGDGKITIIDQTGKVHWYAFDWHWTRSISGIQLDIRPIDVTWEYNFDDRLYTKLLTPDCAWDGYVTMCRSLYDESKQVYRLSTPIMAAHRISTETLHVCHPRKYWDGVEASPVVTCENIDLENLYHP